ncbi:hypothetical protein [Candidatus Halobonum tyrrellensis]|uniref:hypothetical protein n=1 Tax=Candidatus Halobonum tyrrellensis TaxID=1431545 RepID=UPI001268D76B|nr:hypothetical protein [Candidatus Halobonum tyrrellensis]
MSTSETPLPTRLVSSTSQTVPIVRHAIGGIASGFTASVRATAFWVAALLPLSYLPLLATGFAGEHALAFLGLLAVNAVGIAVGSGHRTD